MTTEVMIEWNVPEEMSWDALALWVGDDVVAEVRGYVDDVQRWCDDGGACEKDDEL